MRLALLPLLVLCIAHSTLAAPSPIDFDHDIKPIFAQHCYECHGPDKSKAGLRLDDEKIAKSVLKSDAKAIAPGKPEASELIRRIKSDDPEEQMPPKGQRLTAQQIQKLEQWIQQGATWQLHWAYRPITRPDASASIDKFILQQLDQHKIPPSAPADPHTLIKRLHYDLIGLPPSLEEADRFAANPSDAAYEQLVDRLLASKHFGERFGRHWLDKARYADSDGYEKDNPRPDAWKYRDWVIDAFNRDLPFDEFTIHQLAGDLLPKATDQHKLATAFHRQTLTNKEGGVDAEQWRVEAVFDRVETTGAVWLGLTVGCARCHTHKYDSITQREYYQLFAFFNNADEVDVRIPTSSAAMAKYQKALAAYKPKEAALQSLISNLKSEISRSIPWAPDLHEVISQLSLRRLSTRSDPLEHFFKSNLELPTLTKQLAALKLDEPRPPLMQVRVLAQRDKNPRPTHLMIRGDFLRPDESVTPATLSSLHPLKPKAPTTQPTRLDLAHWLMDENNPITARVAANDIWLHLFGHGLVRTPNDFGVRGEKPTHPDLLDYLATEYRRLGWSRKALIKQIVLSQTYRQSSKLRPDLAGIDPENRLLARQNRFRVQGEIVSDLTLAASGLLSKKIGGPSVFPPLPPDVAALSYANNFIWKTSTGEDRYRRAMYTFFKRTAPHPSLMTFDCPDSNATTIARTSSNTPLQALVTLNNESFAEAAQAMSKRILVGAQNPAHDDLAIIQEAFRLCAIRRADSQELSTLKHLLDRSRAYYKNHPTEARSAIAKHPAPNIDPTDQAPWAAVCRILLNLDEFLTRE